MHNTIEVREAARLVGRKESQRTLFSQLNMSVAAGETLCISGPSGSGKSTVLNCIGLLEKFSAGQLWLNGEDVTNASLRRRLALRRRELGFLFQDFALIDNETVHRNVALARPTRTRDNHHFPTVREALSYVGIEAHHDAFVYELSGGEQQRVAMARILVRQPTIILADEPTASLDRENATSILHLLKNLANQGSCVIMVSHDPWVSAQADTIFDLTEFIPTSSHSHSIPHLMGN